VRRDKDSLSAGRGGRRRPSWFIEVDVSARGSTYEMRGGGVVLTGRNVLGGS